ncbi:MAG: hypothetical protein E6G07_10330 [Actinobacteria bacterium]|nr:MAG: hypothetical protein E6G07_10330 [Actinomycetota bacterium]
MTEYTNGVTPGFSGADPEKIVRGPDGNLWFTNEEDPGRIMRITPAGVVTVVATGGATSNFDANSKPAGITAGSDGNLWFTEFGDPGRIARITPGGAVTRMATGGVTSNFDTNSRPSAITAGPGGNLPLASPPIRRPRRSRPVPMETCGSRVAAIRDSSSGSRPGAS